MAASKKISSLEEKKIFEQARELDNKVNEGDRRKILKLFGYKKKGAELMIKTKVPLQVAYHIALTHFNLRKEGIGAFLK